MTFSDTAIRKNISNEPSIEEIVNLTNLCCEILQPVRENFNRVVRINSGFRSAELCKAIGSSPKSQHTKGQAADFEIMGLPNSDLASFIYNNFDFDQLILEYHDPKIDINSGWVHCSYRKDGQNRKQSLIINKSTKGKYLPWKP